MAVGDLFTFTTNPEFHPIIHDQRIPAMEVRYLIPVLTGIYGHCSAFRTEELTLVWGISYISYVETIQHLNIQAELFILGLFH